MSKGSFAHVTMLGRLGKDPEVFDTQGGKRIVTLSIATTSGFGTNETTSWWPVKIFDERKGKVATDFLKKGSRVLITGEPVIRKWTPRDGGAERFSAEIHCGFTGEITLVDPKEDGGTGQRNAGSDDGYRGRTPEPKPAFHTDLDDDVPF